MFEGGNGLVGSDDLADDAAPIFYTFEQVEAALVEAHDLWRRSPRVGHKAVRSCWPEFREHLVGLGLDDAYGVADVDGVVREPRPLPLSRAEVARRDAVSAWLLFIPDDVNRRIVKLATAQLSAGMARVSWAKVRDDLRDGRVKRGRGICSERYDAAINAICCALNNPDALAMIRDGARPREIALAFGMDVREACVMVRRLRGR